MFDKNKKSKLTLIVDGNWLFMSRISVMKKNKFASDEDLMNDLKILLIKSINVVLRTFPDIDNIMFVADGGSWRKQISIPECLKTEGITYKGNRCHDDSLDWDYVFESYDKFIKDLEACGINTFQEKDIEGDDWCWYLSSKLNDEGTNCIIWSKDRDLTQLVHTNTNGCFTGWWNKDNGLLVEDKQIDDMDFFFNFDFNENEKLLNNIVLKTSLTKINPHDVVIDKIIKGDAGDNIFPVLTRKSANSDKEFRVTTKDIDFSLDIHNKDNVLTYFNNLLNSKKYIGKVFKSINDILDHFDYNIKMVELSETSYPDSVIELMNNHNKYVLSKDTKLIEAKLIANKNTVINILEEI